MCRAVLRYAVDCMKPHCWGNRHVLLVLLLPLRLEPTHGATHPCLAESKL